MTCNTRYADAEDYAKMWCITWPMDCEDQSYIERALDITAGRIHLARAAQDACSCTLSDAATLALRELNCILAAVMYNCPCANAALDDTFKAALLDDANNRLQAIADGRLELCQGETGAEFPSVDWAEHGTTAFARREIVQRSYNRYS